MRSRASHLPLGAVLAYHTLGDRRRSGLPRAADMSSMSSQYKVACLNCSAQLYIELPPGCVNFQCCACYAVHKVLESDPARAADENRKRKRKDRKGTGGYEPRELTAYNKFMRDQLASLKEANPSLSHRDAFKLVSAKVRLLTNLLLP